MKNVVSQTDATKGNATAQPVKFEFIREERNCPFNTDPKNAKRKLYDFKIIINGEHRADWNRRDSQGRGYSMWAHVTRGHRQISRLIISPRGWETKRVVQVESQAEFSDATQAAFNEGIIPTLAELSGIEAAYDRAKQEEAEESDRRDKLARAEAAAPEMLAALQAIMADFELSRNDWPEDTVTVLHNAQAAIDKATTV